MKHKFSPDNILQDKRSKEPSLTIHACLFGVDELMYSVKYLGDDENVLRSAKCIHKFYELKKDLNEPSRYTRQNRYR